MSQGQGIPKHIPTDYENTGKLYPKKDLFIDGEYVCTSSQFLSCEGFKKWYCQSQDIGPKRVSVRLR